MSDVNPYVVVGSPNYAAPLVNFSALNPNSNNKQQQGQQNQNNNQGQNQNQTWASRLRSLLTPQQQAPTGQQAYQQPGQPLNLNPGTVSGANDMLSGIY